MSSTCIVCLGDLGESSSDIPALLSASAKSPGERSPDHQDAVLDAPAPTTSTTQDEPPSLIAHLQPCGHNLHNDCLTPWVERANSCPICRQSFYTVQLSDKIGGMSPPCIESSLPLILNLGDVISSYAVEDKAQVADLDPSMFLEVPADDPDEDEPCQVCEEDDNEDVLMYCDGCQKLWHTYCVGLQEVPYGHWFCDSCRSQRETDPRSSRSREPNRRGHRRRTRGQQRRYRNQYLSTDSSWLQVWQSVYNRTSLDLDFPYDDEDEDAATLLRRHRQRNDESRRDHHGWQIRQQIAEFNGAGDSFRATESTLFDHRLPSVARPVQAVTADQSPEEVDAWNAFDQAVAADHQSRPMRGKKRKSAASSPVEPDPSLAVRPIKRARPNSLRTAINVPTGSAAPTIATRQSPRSSSPRPAHINGNHEPSFLQSLLREVEGSATQGQGGRLYNPSSTNGQSPPAEQSSPPPLSPALSPLTSTHPSPRAISTTPPPLNHARPTSPTGLSSSIQPVYPASSGTTSRASPEPLLQPTPRNGHRDNSHSRIPILALQAGPHRKDSVPFQHSSPPPSRPRSNEASPSRPPLSFNAKSDVQKMVSAVLKPFYSDQVISKEEYTNVNRDTCHKLYDKIGDFEALDIEGRAKWEKVAGEEVSRAIGELKGTLMSSGES